MHIRLTPARLAIFAACIAIFWLLGGFTPLDTRLAGEFRLGRGYHNNWFKHILGFIAGAVSVSFIEHKVGHMDPTSLRAAYVLFGIVFMVINVIWQNALVQSL